jgi:hypothetical protein
MIFSKIIILFNNLILIKFWEKFQKKNVFKRYFENLEFSFLLKVI